MLVHGWACRRNDWEGVARALAVHHRVIALDLPWHGESTSTRASWSMADLGDLVATVATHEDAGDAVLVGHSMGAAVAVEAAIQMTGVREVVSVDGLHFMHMYPRMSPADADRAIAPFVADPPTAIRALCARAFTPDADPALVTRVTDEMSVIDAVAGPAMLRELFLWDMDAALARASAKGVSVRVIAARPLLAAAAVARYGTRMQITPVDLGGHFFLRERPVQTAVLIRDVAARPPGASPAS